MTFKERGAIGEKAESRAESYFSKAGYFIARYGLNAKDVKDAYRVWHHIPPVLTGTPDFIMVVKDIPYFLEVKSCADYLKMKMHDIDIYKKWNNKLFPEVRLLMFVYSTSKNEHFIFTFDKLLRLVRQNNYPIERYKNNNKPYYKIPVEDLDG